MQDKSGEPEQTLLDLSSLPIGFVLISTDAHLGGRGVEGGVSSHPTDFLGVTKILRFKCFRISDAFCMQFF